MTKADKKKFIKSLTNSVRDAVLARVDRIPENWDGLELREYLAEEFARECVLSRPSRSGDFKSRLRDYRNDIATSGSL